jgi:hypothetical protein
MRYISVIFLTTLLFSGCSKKELNTNADKIGGGVKSIEEGAKEIVKGKE